MSVDKTQLAELQRLITALQAMDGLLTGLGDANSLQVRLQTSLGETGFIEMTPDMTEFSQVLSAVKSSASERSTLLLAQIEAILAVKQ
jgi:hypothetical protein